VLALVGGAEAAFGGGGAAKGKKVVKKAPVKKSPAKAPELILLDSLLQEIKYNV